MPHRLLGYLTLLAGAIFLASSITFVYHTRVKPWVPATAFADDIGNLKVDNPVQVAGVSVGKVEAIGREGNLARVDLRLRRELRLKSDYRLLNVDVGLMGDRALVLFPGDTGTPTGIGDLRIDFVPGIAEGMSRANSLKGMISDLKLVFARAARRDPANDSLFTTKFNTVVRAVDRMTLALDKAVTVRESAINGDVRRLRTLSRTARRLYRDAAPTAQKSIAWSSKASAGLLKLLDALEPLVNDLDRLSESLSKSGSWVLWLADGGENYRALFDTLDKLNKALNSLRTRGLGLDLDLF